MYRVFNFIKRYDEREEGKKRAREAVAEAWENYDKRMVEHRKKHNNSSSIEL